MQVLRFHFSKVHFPAAVLVAGFLLMGIGLFTSTANAEDQDDARAYSSLTESQKVGLIDHVIRQGDLKLGEVLLSTTKFEDPLARQKALYLLGGLRKSQGRLDDAILIFRVLLADNPGFKQVRVELADTLRAAGQHEAAKHQFNLLINSGIDEDSKNAFQQYVDSIDGAKPFSMSGFLTLAPSTNLNNGTSAQTFLVGGIPFAINPTSRANSGVGMKAGINAAYTKKLTANLEGYLAAGVAHREYEGRVFDQTSLNASVGVKYRFAGDMIGTELFAQREFFAHNSLNHTLGARIYGKKRLSPRSLLSTSAFASRTEYAKSPISNSKQFHLDARLTYGISANTSVSVETGFDRVEVPRLKQAAYRGAYGKIKIYHEFSNGITSWVELTAGRRNYDGVHAGYAHARHDRHGRVSLSFLKRDWSFKGFSPKIEVFYQRQKSDVVFYDYNAKGVNLTLTKQF